MQKCDKEGQIFVCKMGENTILEVRAETSMISGPIHRPQANTSEERIRIHRNAANPDPQDCVLRNLLGQLLKHSSSRSSYSLLFRPRPSIRGVISRLL
jgi:hypothetical protein